MNILGRGHQGVVVSDGKGSVKKFYLSKAEAHKEQEQLTFLEQIQKEGFDIGCAISRIVDITGSGKWDIDGKTYTYCVRLEHIPGVSAKRVSSNLSAEQIETLGRDLGSISFSLHEQGRTYKDLWRRRFTRNGKELIDHLLEDKAGQVLGEESDEDIKEKVKGALQYLKSRRVRLDAHSTLNHRDLSLSNVQMAEDGHVTGLVDWGSLGLANPSLSMYELIYEPVWPYVKRRYEALGGSIEEDVAYAAAVIHLAWAPIISRQLGIPLHESETRVVFERMYEAFRRELHP